MNISFRPSLAILILLCLLNSSCRNQMSSWIYPGNEFNVRNGKLIQAASTDTTGGNNDRINILPGQKATILDVDGPGVITRIWITIDSRDPDALRNIVLRAWWDNEENPSVEVPVGDFFGCAFNYKHYTAQYTGMSSGGYYCYFPMPFNKTARVEIENESEMELFAFYYHIDYYKLNKRPGYPLYFHSSWSRDYKTTGDSNFVALKAEGKGHFVGMNFNGQPYNKSLFYLEGDEMIYVDGEKRPSVCGTGFEDYFTSGWYFKNGEYSALWHGLIQLDEKTGRVSAYRHHIPDAIPFDKSIKVTYEHGTENEAIADFSTAVFWYQDEPHRKFDQLPCAGQRKPLRRPIEKNIIEIEETKISGSYLIEDMSMEGVDWSGNSQVIFNGGNNSRYTIIIDNLEENAYDIQIYPTAGPRYGKFTIGTSNGESVSYDAYNRNIIPSGPIEINAVPVADRAISLIMTVNGKNPESAGYDVAIDALTLTPARDYIDDWWMIGPFPNPRESDFLRYGLDSVYPPEKEINLDEAYTGAEDKKVRWSKYMNGGAGYDMKLWDKFSPSEFIVIYALTWIYSPEEKNVPLMFGSDDGAKVFLNDIELYRFLNVRVAEPDQERIEIPLKKGWNKLLIKAENNFGGFAFYARLIDRERNLIISPDREMN